MKSTYIICRSKNLQFIIRNYWHRFMSGEFPIISITNKNMIDRNEFKIGIIGLSFVLIKKF